MTIPRMLDILRHSSLIWMMTMIICHYVQLVKSSGTFQVRVLSFLTPETHHADPNFPNFGSHGNGSKHNIIIDDELDLETSNCSVHISICLSHHLLPLPRNIECTLGKEVQTTWRSRENIEIPFSFKWPGAMTASVTATCLCQEDAQPLNRTIGHLVFAHGVLPTQAWTLIPHRVPPSSITGDTFDFRLPSREPDMTSPTLDTSVASGLNGDVKERHIPSNKLNTENEIRKLEKEKETETYLGKTVHDSVKANTRIIKTKKDRDKLVIQKDGNGLNKPDYSNFDDFRLSDGKQFLEVIKDTSNNFTAGNDSRENTTLDKGKNEREAIFDIIPNDQTSVSYRSGGVSMIFRVVCQQHYFGDGCSDFCRPKDDMFGHYRCSEKGEKLCLSGWTGSRCTTAVCRQQCPLERGTCSNPDECTCRPGWYGHECEQCRTARGCRHGRCEHRPGQCLCHKGWTGPLCDVETQFCVDNKPCHNQGRCVHDLSHNYTCVCTPGYTGTNCQVPVCHDYFCLHGGTCLTSEGTRYCLCPDPFKGPRCQHVDLTKDKTTKSNIIDTDTHRKGSTASLSQSQSLTASKSNQQMGGVCDDVTTCQNGGECVRSSRSDGFGCRCQEPYEGEFCEIDPRDPCEEYVCVNKGRCKVRDGAPQCVCRSGFSGDFCERKLSTTCSSSQFCYNGGTCIVHKRKYKCVCRKNYFGKRCENKASHKSNNDNDNYSKRNKKEIKVHVWTVRMSSSKESCASSRAHFTSGVIILLFNLILIHVSIQYCVSPL